jgi:hypothetical protein
VKPASSPADAEVAGNWSPQQDALSHGCSISASTDKAAATKKRKSERFSLPCQSNDRQAHSADAAAAALGGAVFVSNAPRRYWRLQTRGDSGFEGKTQANMACALHTAGEKRLAAAELPDR